MDRLYDSLAQWRSASTLFLTAFLLLIVTAPAARAADPCSIDQRPAATLLLPYFEVDPANPSGLTTLFSINNASAAAVLANVVVWTDLGVPTLGFQVYLTGYDVQTINLRDIFHGNLPGTASDLQDPQDVISPHGEYSQDLNFASCSGTLPYQPLPAALVVHLEDAHTGRFSSVLGGCAGQDLRDGRIRGYVTMDTVGDCTLKVPSDSGYFGPGGVATNQNVLWGDYLYVDPAAKYSDGENLVRIKAFPGVFQPGDLTFYGRYVGMSGADARQPLATTWASRYVNGGTFSGGTDVVAWRDSGRIVRPFPCGTQPAGFPLQWSREVTFNEEEQPQVIPLTPVIPGQPPTMPGAMAFPAEANKVHVGSAAFPVPFNFGWLFFDLNSPNPASPEGRDIRQSWMATIMKAQGQYSAGFSATPFDSACSPVAPLLP
ncbi:MAG TPA: hypothetical protein VLB76_21285 [Thermoanaerobaculia bacterium]|jgi:hypothetical protein|nr:hypothetical protein [Thermoanaerobaculia bacterium]